jgi:FtsP/CotA-like multicopper oxidase with cupredoxin domain
MILSRRQVMTGLLATPLAARTVNASSFAELKVGTRVIEVNGKPAKVFGIANDRGTQGLSVLLKEQFQARVNNTIAEDTLIHWHGLKPPSAQDGVPMLSQNVLRSGEVFDYDFRNTRSGTHWMHSHYGLQEQQMLSAPLIVRETDAPLLDEQEHVVMLHDFTFRDPQEILQELKGGGGGHADHMNMLGMGDVKYDAYLANDRTLRDPEIVRVDKGTRVRLRFINAAAASNMWIRLKAR